MRIVLRIDDDVDSLLTEEMRRRFIVTPRPMGLPEGLSYDNIGELIQHLEGPDHK